MRRRDLGVFLGAAALSAGGLRRASAAEPQKLRIAIQDGLAYLPFIVMERGKLVEQAAAKAGLTVETVWTRLASGAVMNDSLLAGRIDIGTGGVPGLALIWDRTQRGLRIKSIGAWASVPNYLNVKRADVNDPRDFGPQDRIAVPAVKVSNQAIYLQMLSEKIYGPGVFDRFDARTVSLAHVEGMQAMLAKGSEITAHFTIEPYATREREHGAKTLLSSFDILRGPATTSAMWATSAFYEKNETLVRAFLAALDEAVASIDADREKAARLYLAGARSKESLDDIKKMLGDPNMRFGSKPFGVMAQVEFLARTGYVKTKPSSWADLFFPPIVAAGGS